VLPWALPWCDIQRAMMVVALRLPRLGLPLTQPIKVVKRRRLDTKKAKRQQQTRRKDNLFKKAREYCLECGAYVYLAIK
jgi:hypothetical protein